MVIRQYGVFLVNLDPTLGHEMQKTRPCLVVSSDEMNKHIETVIIAPMTTKSRYYPTRVCHSGFRTDKDGSCWIRYAP